MNDLLELQKETGKSFLYEAAACASIPVIRNLEEYYDNDLLHSIKAIVNGSTNFILTKMFEEGLDFKQALLLAQQAGFAESNPVLDVAVGQVRAGLQRQARARIGTAQIGQQLGGLVARQAQGIGRQSG